MRCFISYLTKICFIVFAALLSLRISSFAQNDKPGKSEWVHFNDYGKLVYMETKTGYKIMDFSFAGYMGGGAKIPDVETKIIITPKDGDNTTAIQNAIDEVSKYATGKWIQRRCAFKAGNI